MKKEVKVWKVLTAKDRSSVVFSGDAMLIYPVGELVKPKIPRSKIFCFKTKENAYQFAINQDKDLSIHKAIAINPKPIEAILMHREMLLVEKFWKIPDGRLFALAAAPWGTLVCDALKCLE